MHYSDDSENYTNVVHYRNNICSTTKTSSALLKMDINYQIYINNYSVCSALPKVVVHYLALLPSFQGMVDVYRPGFNPGQPVKQINFESPTKVRVVWVLGADKPCIEKSWCVSHHCEHC